MEDITDDDKFAALQLQSRWRAKRAQCDFDMLQSQGLNPVALGFLRQKRSALKIVKPEDASGNLDDQAASATSLLSSMEKGVLKQSLGVAFDLVKPDMALLIAAVLFTSASIVMLFFIPQFMLLAARLLFYNDDGQVRLEEFVVQLIIFSCVVSVASFISQFIWKLMMERWGSRVECILIYISAQNSKLIRKTEVDDVRKKDVSAAKRVLFTSLPQMYSSVCAIGMGLGMIFWQSWLLGVLVVGFCIIISLLGSFYDKYMHQKSQLKKYLKEQEDERWSFLHSEDSQGAMNDVIALNKFKAKSSKRSAIIDIGVGGLYRLAFFMAPVFYLYAGGASVKSRVIESYQIVFCIFYFGYCLIVLHFLNKSIVDFCMHVHSIARVSALIPEDPRDVQNILEKVSEYDAVGSVEGSSVQREKKSNASIMMLLASFLILGGIGVFIGFASARLSKLMVTVDTMPSINPSTTVSTNSTTQPKTLRKDHKTHAKELALKESLQSFSTEGQLHDLVIRSHRPRLGLILGKGAGKRKMHQLQSTTSTNVFVTLCLQPIQNNTCTTPFTLSLNDATTQLYFAVKNASNVPVSFQVILNAAQQQYPCNQSTGVVYQDQCMANSFGTGTCSNVLRSMRCPGTYTIRSVVGSNQEDRVVLNVMTYALPTPRVLPDPMPSTWVGRAIIQTLCDVPPPLRPCDVAIQYVVQGQGRELASGIVPNGFEIPSNATSVVGSFSLSIGCIPKIGFCAVDDAAAAAVAAKYNPTFKSVNFVVNAAPNVLNPPQFNQDSTNTPPYRLTLTHADPSTQIFYSLSGEEGYEVGAPTLRGEILYDAILGIQFTQIGHFTVWAQAKKSGNTPSPVVRFDVDLFDPAADTSSNNCPMLSFTCKVTGIPGFPNGFSPASDERAAQDRSTGNGLPTSKPCSPKGGPTALMARCSQIIASQLSLGMIEAVLASSSVVTVEASWMRWDGAIKTKDGKYTLEKKSVGNVASDPSKATIEKLTSLPGTDYELLLVEEPCSNFNGFDRKVDCQFRKSCEWSETYQLCLDIPCANLKDRLSCFGSSLMCSWEVALPGSEIGICRSMQCHEFSDSKRCGAHGCLWDEPRSVCLNAPCYTQVRQSDCQLPCIWRPTKYTPPVVPFSSPSPPQTQRHLLQTPDPYSSLTSAPSYQNPYGSSSQRSNIANAIADSSALDPSSGECVQPTCGFWNEIQDLYRRETMCLQSHCLFDHMSQMCKYSKCGSLSDADSCNAQHCLWTPKPQAQRSVDNMVEFHCIQRGCSEFQNNPAECAANNCFFNTQNGKCLPPDLSTLGPKECEAWGQAWIGSDQVCMPRPCAYDEQLPTVYAPAQNYPLCRTSETIPTKVDCSNYNSEDACMAVFDGVYSLCEWKFGMCSFKACTSYVSISSCQRGKSCRWVMPRAPPFTNTTLPILQLESCAGIMLSSTPTPAELTACTSIGCVVRTASINPVSYACVRAPAQTVSPAAQKCASSSIPCSSPCVENPNKPDACVLGVYSESSPSDLSSSPNVGLCVPAPCEARTQSDCMDSINNHCMFNTKTSRCEMAPCSFFSKDESLCNNVFQFGAPCQYVRKGGSGVCEPYPCEMRTNENCYAKNRGSCILAPPSATMGYSVQLPSTCRSAACSEIAVREICWQNRECKWFEDWRGTSLISSSCQRRKCREIETKDSCSDRKDCFWTSAGSCDVTPCSYLGRFECSVAPHCLVGFVDDSTSVDVSRTTTSRDSLYGTSAPSYAPGYSSSHRRLLQMLQNTSFGYSSQITICRRKPCETITASTACSEVGCQPSVKIGQKVEIKCYETCSRLTTADECQTSGSICAFDAETKVCFLRACEAMTSPDTCAYARGGLCVWNGNNCSASTAKSLSEHRQAKAFRSLATEDASTPDHQRKPKTSETVSHPLYQKYHRHALKKNVQTKYTPSGLNVPLRKTHAPVDMPHDAPSTRQKGSRREHPHPRGMHKVVSRRHVATFRTLEIPSTDGKSMATRLPVTGSARTTADNYLSNAQQNTDVTNLRSGENFQGACQAMTEDIARRVAEKECPLTLLALASQTQCDLSSITGFQVSKEQLQQGPLPKDYYFLQCQKGVLVPKIEEFNYLTGGHGTIVTVVSSENVKRAFNNVKLTGAGGDLKSQIRVDQGGQGGFLVEMLKKTALTTPKVPERASPSGSDTPHDVPPQTNAVKLDVIEGQLSKPELNSNFQDIANCHNDAACLQSQVNNLAATALTGATTEVSTVKPLTELGSAPASGSSPSASGKAPAGVEKGTGNQSPFPADDTINRCLLENTMPYPLRIYPGSIVLAPFNAPNDGQSPTLFARAVVIDQVRGSSGETLWNVGFIPPVSQMNTDAQQAVRTSQGAAQRRRRSFRVMSNPANIGSTQQQYSQGDSDIRKNAESFFSTTERQFPAKWIVPLLPVTSTPVEVEGTAPQSLTNVLSESVVVPNDLIALFRSPQCTPSNKLFEARIATAMPQDYSGSDVSDTLRVYTLSVNYAQGECASAGSPDTTVKDLSSFSIQHEYLYGLNVDAYQKVKKCVGVERIFGAPIPSTQSTTTYDGGVKTVTSTDNSAAIPSSKSHNFRAQQSYSDNQRAAAASTWVPSSSNSPTFASSQYTQLNPPTSGPNMGTLPPSQGVPLGTPSSIQVPQGTTVLPQQLQCASLAPQEWAVHITGSRTNVPSGAIIQCQIRRADLASESEPRIALWHQNEEATLIPSQPIQTPDGRQVYPIYRYSAKGDGGLVESGVYLTKEELAWSSQEVDGTVKFQFRTPPSFLGIDSLVVRHGSAQPILSETFRILDPHVRVEDVGFHWNQTKEYRIDFDTDAQRGVYFPFEWRDPVWTYFTEMPDADRPPQTRGTGPQGGLGASGSRYFVADASLPSEFRRGGGGRLYTPMVRIPTDPGIDTLLGFAYYFYGEPKDMPTIQILASTTFGYEWQPITPTWPPKGWENGQQSDIDNINQNKWKYHEISIARFQGKSVIFAFEVKWKNEIKADKNNDNQHNVANQGDIAIDDIVIRRRTPDYLVTQSEILAERFSDGTDQLPDCANKEGPRPVVSLPGGWKESVGIGIASLSRLQLDPPLGFGEIIPPPPVSDWDIATDKLLLADAPSCPGTVSYVESPVIQLDPSVELSFVVHTYQSGGTMKYEVKVNGTATYRVPSFEETQLSTFHIEINLGDTWQNVPGLDAWTGVPHTWATQVVPLTHFKGMVVQFRLVVKLGAHHTTPSLFALPRIIPSNDNVQALNLNRPPVPPRESCGSVEPCCNTYQSQMECQQKEYRGCKWVPVPQALCAFVPPASSTARPMAYATFVTPCITCAMGTTVPVDVLNGNSYAIMINVSGTVFNDYVMNRSVLGDVIDNIVGTSVLFGWEPLRNNAENREMMLRQARIINNVAIVIPIVGKLSLSSDVPEDHLIVTVPASATLYKNDIPAVTTLAYYLPRGNKRATNSQMDVNPLTVSVSDLTSSQDFIGDPMTITITAVALGGLPIKRFDPTDVLQPQRFVVTCSTDGPCLQRVTDVGLPPRSVFHQRFAELFPHPETALTYIEPGPQTLVYPGMNGGKAEGSSQIVTGDPKVSSQQPSQATVVGFTLTLTAVKGLSLDHDETICIDYAEWLGTQVCFDIMRKRPSAPLLSPSSNPTDRHYDTLFVGVRLPLGVSQDLYNLRVDVYRKDKTVFPDPASYIIRDVQGHIPVHSNEGEVKAWAEPKDTTTKLLSSDVAVASYNVISRFITEVKSSCVSNAPCRSVLSGYWLGNGVASVANIDSVLLPLRGGEGDSPCDDLVAGSKDTKSGVLVDQSILDPNAFPQVTVDFGTKPAGQYVVCVLPRNLGAPFKYFEVSSLAIKSP